MISSQFFGGHIPSPPPSPTAPPRSVSTAAYATAATSAAAVTSSSLSTAPSSLYDILGLPVTATFPEIKSAYRRLARTCHPDALPNNSASDRFLRLQTAYATLSDPDQRAAYDRRLVLPPRQVMNGAAHRRYASFSRSPSFPGFGGRKKRTWETDQCW